MKKLITLAMTFIMIIVMATSSFAETVADGGSVTEDVDVIINKNEVQTVYSVDIVWDSLEFTYNLGNGRWDPTDHTVEGGSAGWNIDSAKITVTNHSNAAVNIEAAFADEPTTATVNGVTAIPHSDYTWRITEFNSNNTRLLSVEEVKQKIASLEYIRGRLEEFKGEKR